MGDYSSSLVMRLLAVISHAAVALALVLAVVFPVFGIALGLLSAALSSYLRSRGSGRYGTAIAIVVIGINVIALVLSLPAGVVADSVFVVPD